MSTINRTTLTGGDSLRPSIVSTDVMDDQPHSSPCCENDARDARQGSEPLKKCGVERPDSRLVVAVQRGMDAERQQAPRIEPGLDPLEVAEGSA